MKTKQIKAVKYHPFAHQLSNQNEHYPKYNNPTTQCVYDNDSGNILIFPFLQLHAIRRTSLYLLWSHFFPICWQYCPIRLHLQEKSTNHQSRKIGPQLGHLSSFRLGHMSLFRFFIFSTKIVLFVIVFFLLFMLGKDWYFYGSISSLNI